MSRENITHKIIEMNDEGYSYEQIREHLVGSNYSPELVDRVIYEFKLSKLVDFVQEKKGKGYNENSIKKLLTTLGYSSKDADKAIFHSKYDEKAKQDSLDETSSTKDLSSEASSDKASSSKDSSTKDLSSEASSAKDSSSKDSSTKNLSSEASSAKDSSSKDSSTKDLSSEASLDNEGESSSSNDDRENSENKDEDDSNDDYFPFIIVGEAPEPPATEDNSQDDSSSGISEDVAETSTSKSIEKGLSEKTSSSKKESDAKLSEKSKSSDVSKASFPLSPWKISRKRLYFQNLLDVFRSLVNSLRLEVFSSFSVYHFMIISLGLITVLVFFFFFFIDDEGGENGLFVPGDERNGISAVGDEGNGVVLPEFSVDPYSREIRPDSEIVYNMFPEEMPEEDFEVVVNYSLKAEEDQKVVLEDNKVTSIKALKEDQSILSFDEELTPGNYTLKILISSGIEKKELEETFLVKKTNDEYCEGCPEGEVCFGGQCCEPETCISLGYECGKSNDGCGGMLYCGECLEGETCVDGQCIAEEGACRNNKSVSWTAGSKDGDDCGPVKFGDRHTADGDSNEVTYSNDYKGKASFECVEGSWEFVEGSCGEREKEEYRLSVKVEGNGSTVPEEGSHLYQEDRTVEVTAEAEKGWVFDGFSGDCAGESCVLQMNEDNEVTANFVEKKEICIKESFISWSDENGEGSDCGPVPLGQGNSSYGEEVVVNYTGEEYSGIATYECYDGDWIFVEGSCERECVSEVEKKCDEGDVYWYDSCGNKEELEEECEHGCQDGECLEEYTLTINIEGSGSTEPIEGEHSYNEGESVDIEATPDEGWIFEKWEGITDSSDKEQSIELDEDKEITAVFVEEEDNGEEEGPLIGRVVGENDPVGVAGAFIDAADLGEYNRSSNIVFLLEDEVLESDVGDAPFAAVVINEFAENGEEWDGEEIVLTSGKSYKMKHKDVYMVGEEAFGLEADSEEVADAFYEEFEKSGIDAEIDGHEVTLEEAEFLHEDSSEVIGQINGEQKEIEFNSSDDKWQGEKLTISIDEETTTEFEVVSHSYSILREDENIKGGFSENMQHSEIVTSIKNALEVSTTLMVDGNGFLLEEGGLDVEESSDELIEYTWRFFIEFEPPSDWAEEEGNVTIDREGEQVTYIFDYDYDDNLLRIFSAD